MHRHWVQTAGLGRLKTYAAKQNKVFIRDLNADLIEDFKTYGFPKDMADTSKGTNVSKVMAFFRTAYSRGWILEALAEKIETFTAVYEQKQPFTEEEVRLILEGASNLKGGTHAYASKPKTFRLLLELMNETGMRCGDAIRYDPRKCTKSKLLWKYAFSPQKQQVAKKKKIVKIFLTERLKIAIDECEWMSKTLPFAYRSTKGDDTNYMQNEVYERMKSIGSKVGVEDCRPHRLRDSFAVRSLINGIPLEDVSRLLGHSSIAITEKYYAAWTPDREDVLEGRLFASFATA